MGKTMTKTSNRQTKANRHNAAKSTGPRTAEGKARSRLNALKHGLRAEQVVVLLGGPNPEDPRDFEDLRDGLIDDRKPIGALEELLVERLAVGFWRLRRAYRFEAETIAQANRVSPVSKMLDDLSGLPAPEPVEHLLPKVQNLDKLVRYESMIDRELLRSMALLQRVQQRRKLDEEPADPFDLPPASDSPARAGATADRRSEKSEGSRVRGSEEMRISDFGLRNEERRQREVGMPKPNNTGRSEPRTTDHKPGENSSGRTNPSAPMPNAANRLRPNETLRAPRNANGLHRAAGFSPRGPTKCENATHCDRPRGLKAHGSGGKRNRQATATHGR